jgi:MFS family permease
MAVRFIIFLGVVSLFGDMTYEGARSIVGPYLATLGASGTAVGVIAGLGELIGYAVRWVSGYVGDKTGRYWTVTIVGYLFNLFAVPLLALASNWQGAAALIVAERMGRGLRTPTRDAMLSHASAQTGAGWAFGLHEAMDTTGAIIGPLAVSVALYLGHGYRMSFAMLLVPALLSIAVLLVARSQFPAPRDLEAREIIDEPMALPLNFWIYSTGAAFIGAGFADFSLIAYHFGKTAVVSATSVPILYAATMVSAAVAAIALGRLFDRIGIEVMGPATIVSALSAPLVFLGGPAAVVVGALCWGVGMGAQESVMRAAIGPMAAANHRATAFGLFHMIFGVAWFLGSVLLGILYDYSIPALAMVSFFLQLAGIPILIMSKRLKSEKV